MQIITISRGGHAFGKEVAIRLSQRLGYACIAREEITDAATDQGIPIGKLEIEVMKRRPLTEEGALQMDLFKAFVSVYLCERAKSEDGVVYHGRAGHQVLPGISHVLRVRAIEDAKIRAREVMDQMGLSAAEARRYVEGVDEDLRRWIRVHYNVDWEDPARYDITLNAAHLTEENAAAALTVFHDLPEFQSTPASRQHQDDLLLAARCRLAISRDERTRKVRASVRAEKGAVSVNFLPRQAREAEAIPAVLESEPGIDSLLCTIATTNILYLGEAFDPKAPELDHLISISEKWNAAIELVRVGGEVRGDEPVADAVTQPSPGAYDGGIVDDEVEVEPEIVPGHGIRKVMDRLIKVGRAGGYRELAGDIDRISDRLPHVESYSLVVVGDVFPSKGAARQRMKRDLLSSLSDRFRVPVIGNEELKERFLFGRRQMVSLFLFAVVSVVIYGAVFHFQEPILGFLSAGQTSEGTGVKIAASVAVFAFAPLVAVVVGGLYRNLMKMIGME
jgi:cytidylate kinase